MRRLGSCCCHQVALVSAAVACDAEVRPAPASTSCCIAEARSARSRRASALERRPTNAPPPAARRDVHKAEAAARPPLRSSRASGSRGRGRHVRVTLARLRLLLVLEPCECRQLRILRRRLPLARVRRSLVLHRVRRQEVLACARAHGHGAVGTASDRRAGARAEARGRARPPHAPAGALIARSSGGASCGRGALPA